MVFFSDKANRASPEEQAKLILSRHLSFFARDEEDFEGFIAYHGGEDNPFVEHIKELCQTFTEEKPRLPFGRWQQVGPPVQGSRLQDDLHGSLCGGSRRGRRCSTLVCCRIGGLVQLFASERCHRVQ